MTALIAPPLSLYVHLPWCVRKCPYCDFNSHAIPIAGIPESSYLAALLADLEFAAGEVGGREIVSVFFGGGTPSLFSAPAAGRLIASTLLRLFVAQMFVIPSGSMENTLQVRDRVAVQKIVGFQRGDIVVFRDTLNWLRAGEGRGGSGAEDTDLRRLGS